MSAPKSLWRWILGLAGITYCLLVFGAAVRIHGAGLACPDWPMCFGQVVPTLDFKVSLEWGHRALAGLISLGFVGIGALIGADRSLRRSVGPWWLVAAVVLAVQIVLGGLTVLELLAEWTVASHLITGNTFCALLLILGLLLRDHVLPLERPAVTWSIRAAAAGLGGLVVFQLVWGGLVSSSGAGLACGPAWPNCGGSSWFPTLSGPMGLQVIHRLVAYALVVVVLAVLALTRGRGRTGRLSLLVAGLVSVQVVVGIVNVLLRIPVEVTLLHSAVGDAIFLCTAWLNWEAWRAPVSAVSRHPALVRTQVEAR